MLCVFGCCARHSLQALGCAVLSSTSRYWNDGWDSQGQFCATLGICHGQCSHNPLCLLPQRSYLAIGLNLSWLSWCR